MSDFTELVRARAGSVFRSLKRMREHHGRPVQGSLFPEPVRGMMDEMSPNEAEGLLCLAMVREAEEGDWQRVLAEYGRESERVGCPETAREVEERFYLSLFRACKPEVWMPVVQAFEKMKEDPREALRVMGRGRE